MYGFVVSRYCLAVSGPHSCDQRAAVNSADSYGRGPVYTAAAAAAAYADGTAAAAAAAAAAADDDDGAGDGAIGTSAVDGHASPMLVGLMLLCRCYQIANSKSGST